MQIQVKNGSLRKKPADQILERRYPRHQQQQMLEERRCHTTRLLARQPPAGLRHRAVMRLQVLGI
jgi:hypothetical protein